MTLQSPTDDPPAQGYVKRGDRWPPGPKGVPLLGNMPQLARDVLGFFTEGSRQFGDMWSFNLAGFPVVFLNHPDLLEDVLVRNHRNFTKHSLFWRNVQAVFGKGLLTSEGELWQRQRRLAAPAFSGAPLKRYAETMVRLTEHMLDRWGGDQAIDVHHEAMDLTLRIAAKTLFNADTEQDVAIIDRGFEAVLAEISARFRRPFPIPDAIPIPGNIRYRRGVQKVDELVARIIAERQQSPGDRGDLLSALMAARDEAGQPMSLRQLRDEVVTMLLAGHETTALTLSWTWYLLSRHPEVDRKLAQEVRDVLKGRPATIDDLPLLRFTEQVVTESMRLYPPVYAMGREAIGACEIGGYAIAPKTTVYICPWVTHRDPRWFDDPEAFRPERWDGDLAKRLPRFVYMPFGGGPRICIGNRFAMMEAILILATTAQRFRPELASSQPIVPDPSITLRPKGGVWARPVAR